MLKTLDKEVLEAFQRYPWPGNVRELENVVRQMCIMADGPIVTARDLPDEIVDELVFGALHFDFPIWKSELAWAFVMAKVSYSVQSAATFAAAFSAAVFPDDLPATFLLRFSLLATGTAVRS